MSIREGGGSVDRTPDRIREVAIQVLRQARRHPVSSRQLHREVARAVESHRAARLDALLGELCDAGSVLAFRSGAETAYFWRENLEALKERLCALVNGFHAQHPEEPGVASGAIRSRIADGSTKNAQRSVDSRLFDLALQACCADGRIEVTEAGLRRTGYQPVRKSALDPAVLEERILRYAEERFCNRIEADELSGLLGADAASIRMAVTNLLRSGRLIKLARLYPVKEDRFLCAGIVEEAKARLSAAFRATPRMSTSEIRELLGQTRRTTIPLLEYLDRIGFTRRDGDLRELAAGVDQTGRIGVVSDRTG